MPVCPALGHRISLRTLLPAAEFFGADDIWISGCCGDSRKIESGELFAALPGSRVDGRDYIDEAIQRGAAAVLCEAPRPATGMPACVVANAREAYSRIQHALLGNPSEHLKLIGVTGTNGKTTTSWLIASILAAAGYETGVLGTLGYFDGAMFDEAPWTTPPADQFASYLARMLHNGCTHAVMEVSSHALDQHRVAGARFDAACVTNVRHDHLDYHRTPQQYRQSKLRLLQHLAPEGLTVVNADDHAASAWLAQIDGPVLTVGMRANAEITGTLIEQHPSEQTFLLTAGSETAPVRTRMIGAHHVSNCLVAAAIGLAYGIDLPTVVRGLEAVASVPGRLERIECGQPFGVFVDFAHTPDALESVLATLRPLTRNRLICVFGAGGDRDRQKRPAMGAIAEQLADLVIVTNDNPRNEDPQEIARQILGGLKRPSAAEIVLDRTSAIRWALAAARTGDCVLIAGRGHERYQIMGNRRLALSDADVAREWLYEYKPYAAAS